MPNSNQIPNQIPTSNPNPNPNPNPNANPNPTPVAGPETDPSHALAQLLAGIRPEFDFTASTDFIADGMLDSYDVVALVATLDRTYGISIDGVDILPEHFQSLEAIAALLRSYGIRP